MSLLLDRRTLNRTTLARQHLLAQTTADPMYLVGHLVGLQGQNPLDPYFGLWSRVVGYRPEGLAGMVEAGEAVRGQLMRGTIHLVTRSDWVSMRPVFDPLCARIFGSTQYGKDTRDIDRDLLLSKARRMINERPRTRAELGRSLEPSFPGVPAASLAQVVTYLLPVVQVPPRGVWGKTGEASWSILESDPQVVGRVARTTEELVIRYLRAFGPASVKDIRAWSALTGLAEVISRVRERLVAYVDEKGVELLDVEGVEIADPDTPAPPRFLPEYDNVLLGHSDRSRVFADNGPVPPGWVGNLLVDGFYAGFWKLDPPDLRVSLQVKVTSRQRQEITEEADHLRLFAMPDRPNSSLTFEDHL